MFVAIIGTIRTDTCIPDPDIEGRADTSFDSMMGIIGCIYLRNFQGVELPSLVA